MNDTKLAIEQISPFLKGTQTITFTPISKAACYEEIGSKLKQWRYFKQSKKKKSDIRDYLEKRTGYSHSQLTRLIKRYQQNKQLKKQGYQRHHFAKRYTRNDVLLLARTDEYHQTHIPQRFAPLLNQLYQTHLNAYINYHRPCFFPVIKTDKKGRQCKTYPYDAMMTPCDKFLSLPLPQQYLKPGMTIDKLTTLASLSTDLEAANQTQIARKKLFDTIFKQEKTLLDSTP